MDHVEANHRDVLDKIPNKTKELSVLRRLGISYATVMPCLESIPTLEKTFGPSLVHSCVIWLQRIPVGRRAQILLKILSTSL